MYQSGVGVSQDLHLAKRYYDQSLQVASEAYVPASLALLSLRAQTWFESFFNEESQIHPNHQTSDSSRSSNANAERDVRGDPESEPVGRFEDGLGSRTGMKGEDVLLLLLCAALAIAFYIRRHRLNE